MFCVAFTTLYIVYPLLNFFLGGLNFGVLSDGRLQKYALSAEDLGMFFIYHLVYLTALALSYAILRQQKRPLPTNLQPLQPKATKIIVIGFVLLTGYFTFLWYSFAMNPPPDHWSENCGNQTGSAEVADPTHRSHFHRKDNKRSIHRSGLELGRSDYWDRFWPWFPLHH